jgi:serine/threonine-protein kinase
MAPEQILGGVVDRRADVFAVGIMLYLLTTGRHPFKNHDSAGVLHSISSEEPAPHPSSSLPHYSPALEAVVMKAIAKAPNQRWASADEMRVALQGAVPEAFGLDFEVELGNFLTTQLGERASSKREAMRQAELASELRGQESGALAGPAQSASSLRAVSVDNLFQVRERSILATLRPAEQTASPPPRGKWRPALVGISVGAALLLTLVSLHALRGEHVTAASSGAGLVELNTNLGPSQPAAPIVPHEATPSPSALAPVAPAESSALPTPKRGPAKRMKAHAGLGPHAPSTDLIAPDYAR